MVNVTNLIFEQVELRHELGILMLFWLNLHKPVVALSLPRVQFYSEPEPAGVAEVAGDVGSRSERLDGDAGDLLLLVAIDPGDEVSQYSVIC